MGCMIQPMTRQLSIKDRNIHEYISGYVDGEGCFSVSFSRRDKFLVGWETKPSFSVSQNEDRSETLYEMQKIFDSRFMRKYFSDKTLKYEVRSLNDLLTKVIPHFETYPLRSSKQKDFQLFKKVCLLMKENKHLDKEGLQKIVELAHGMNPSGKRKYSKEIILETLR